MLISAAFPEYDFESFYASAFLVVLNIEEYVYLVFDTINDMGFCFPFSV